MKSPAAITIHAAPCANPDCYWAIVRELPIGRKELCDKCADRAHDLVGMATASMANKASENTREDDE